MATNMVQKDGRYLNAAATQPATPSSGDPVLIGNIPGVAVTDEGADGNATGETTIDTQGVYNLSVKGHNGTANTAISVGDIIYYDTGANGPLNVNSSGTRFGYALEAVASGATTTIKVKIGY